MAIDGYDLNDMMTALSRAHAAGNTGDAQQIAGMIQQHYPAETQQALNATPPVPSLSDFAPPMQVRPLFGPTAPASPAVALPPVDTTPLQQPPSPPQATPIAGGGPNASAAPVSVNPQGAPTNWLSELGGGTLADMAASWVHGIPLVGDQIGAGAATLGRAIGGQGFNPAAGAQDFQAQVARAGARSPIASIAGNVGGAVAGSMALGGAAGAGLGMASKVPLLAPAASRAAQVAEWLGAHPISGGAAAGAIGAAGEDAAKSLGGNGPSLTDAAIDTAMGGITGAGVGGAVHLAVTKLAPAAAAGWQILARKLNGMATSGNPNAERAAAQFMIDKFRIDPAEVAQAQAEHVAATGQPAPLAALIPRFQQAQIAKAAAQNPELGNTLTAGEQAFRNDAQSGLPTILDQTASTVPHPTSPTGASGVQQNQALQTARDTTMDNAMAPIRGTMASVDSGDARTLSNAYAAVRNRLGGIPASDDAEGMMDRVRQAIQDVSDPNIGQSALSLNDVEQLRRTISQAAPSAEDNALAYGNAQKLSQNVAQIGADASPEYADNLARFSTQSRYIEGHQAGLSGTPIDQVKNAPLPGSNNYEAYVQGHGSGVLTGLANKAQASPAGAQTAMQTLGGNQGLNASLAKSYSPAVADQLANAGSRLSQAHAGFRNVAPRSPVGEPEGHSGVAQQLAHGAVLESGGAHGFGVFHFVKGAFAALRGSGKMSEPVAAKTAEWLSSRDPVVQRQAIAVMQRAGIDNATVQRLVGLSAAAGGTIGAGWQVGR